MEQTTIESTTLTMSRKYAASRESVFRALTEPSLLARWFAPNDDFEAHVDRFEAEVGGAYRIEMRHQSGNVHTAVGTIREIHPPERLVYTWTWEGGEMGETLVTWTLDEVEDGTVLTLVHDRFPNEEARANHVDGWMGCLGRLQRLLDHAFVHFLELGLDVNERLFGNVLGDVSEEDFTARLNARTNSMQWIAGHLAHTRAQMARLLDASVDTGMGAFEHPIDDGADYPDKEAIIDAYEKATRVLRERLTGVTGADLAGPAPMPFPVSDSSIGGGIAFLTEHEGYHIGQLGFLRKALGYEAVKYS